MPTWNYTTAHVYGRLVVHDDLASVEDLVRRLTTLHESAAAVPWTVDDAPARFVAGQLRVIVGVELLMTRVQAKRKLSQNRSTDDVGDVITGLRARGDLESAGDVERAQQEPIQRN